MASLFIGRWDKAVMGKVPEELRNRLGLPSPNGHTRPTGICLPRPGGRNCRSRSASPAPPVGQHRNKRPKASDILYIEALAAPDTINTMPEETLLAFADHGKVDGVLSVDGGTPKNYSPDSQSRCGQWGARRRIPEEGARIFDKSWNGLIDTIASKSHVLGKTTQTGGRR